MEILKQPSKVLKMFQEFKHELEERITGFRNMVFFIGKINIVFLTNKRILICISLMLKSSQVNFF